MAGGAIATSYVRLIPTFDGKLKSTIDREVSGVDSKGLGTKIGRGLAKGTESGLGGLKGAMTARFSAASVAVGNIAANAIGKAMGAISSSMDAAVSRMDTIENFPKVMQSLGYESGVAAKSIADIKGHLDGLPSSTSAIASFVQQLAATQGDLDLATRSGLAFNDMMLAGGKSTEAIANAQSAYNKMLAKGKPEMDNWMTLVETAPGQMQQLATSLLGAGKNQSDLYKALQDGTLTMGEFTDAIVRLDSEGGEGFASFESQARAATGGVGTAIENVKNRISAALANIMTAIGQTNISGFIDGISSKFSKLGAIIGGVADNADGSRSATGFIGGLKDGLESAFDGWEPKFAINWDDALGGARDAAERIGELFGGPIAALAQSTDAAMSRMGESLKAASARLDLPDIDWGAVADGISGVVAAASGFSIDVLANGIETVAAVAGRLGEVLAPVLDKMRPGFESAVSAVRSLAGPIADFVSGVGPAFDGMMERIWGHIDDLRPALDAFGEAFNSLAEHMKPLADAIGPLIAEILGNIGSAIVGLAPIVVDLGTAVLSVADAIVSAIGWVGGLFSAVAQGIQGDWDALDAFLGGIPGDIVGFFSGIPAALGGFFESAKSNIVGVFDSIVDFVRGIPGKIVGFFSGIGQRITEAIGSIHFPQPSISMDSIDIGGVGIPIPRITWNARGAIFDGPTVLQGVGEAGREAVLPLEGQYMRPFAQAVASEMGMPDPGLFETMLDEVRSLRADVREARITLDGKAVGEIVTPYVDAGIERSILAHRRGF